MRDERLPVFDELARGHDRYIQHLPHLQQMLIAGDKDRACSAGQRYKLAIIGIAHQREAAGSLAGELAATLEQSLDAAPRYRRNLLSDLVSLAAGGVVPHHLNLPILDGL